MVGTFHFCALSFHYADLVHGAEWVGNPHSFALDGPAIREWHTFLTGLYHR